MLKELIDETRRYLGWSQRIHPELKQFEHQAKDMAGVAILAVTRMRLMARNTDTGQLRREILRLADEMNQWSLALRGQGLCEDEVQL